jgi:hypothetical protein
LRLNRTHQAVPWSIEELGFASSRQKPLLERLMDATILAQELAVEEALRAQALCAESERKLDVDGTLAYQCAPQGLVLVVQLQLEEIARASQTEHFARRGDGTRISADRRYRLGVCSLQPRSATRNEIRKFSGSNLRRAFPADP